MQSSFICAPRKSGLHASIVLIVMVLCSCSTDNDLSEWLDANVWLPHNNVNKTKVEQYKNIVSQSNSFETFIFFTDPHLLNKGGVNIYNRTKYYINGIKKHWEAINYPLVICGGDWIGKDDTPSEAIEKLKFINNLTYKEFGASYLPIVGNHDTNYQGKDEDGTELAGELTHDEYYQALMSHMPDSYYSFQGVNTMFYVLDSYTDWEQEISPYKAAQEIWFAERLLADDYPQSALCIHIFYNGSTIEKRSQFSKDLEGIIVAYNTKNEILVQGKMFDYTATTGHLMFAICGHTHTDMNGVLEDGTPVICTTKTSVEDTPTFDMFCVDYSNNIINSVRCGIGENRLFHMNRYERYILRINSRSHRYSKTVIKNTRCTRMENPI